MSRLSIALVVVAAIVLGIGGKALLSSEYNRGYNAAQRDFAVATQKVQRDTAARSKTQLHSARAKQQKFNYEVEHGLERQPKWSTSAVPADVRNGLCNSGTVHCRPSD